MHSAASVKAAFVCSCALSQALIILLRSVLVVSRFKVGSALGYLPYSNKNGDDFVLSCVWLLYVNSAVGKSSDQLSKLKSI